MTFLGEEMLSSPHLHLFDSFFCELEMRNIVDQFFKENFEEKHRSFGRGDGAEP